MEEQIELKYVTVRDLKDWLYHGAGPSYVSEMVIARQRALAIVTSPVVSDDMEVMSVLLVNGEPAAFCACLPDELEAPVSRTVFWYSALYCKPEYQGRGYGVFLLSHLYEAHEGDMYDVDAIAETDECLKFLGYTVSEFTQYRILFCRSITKHGFKGHLAFFRESLGRFKKSAARKKLYRSCISSDYSLEYVSYIDDELYSFIREYSSEDAMLRSQSVFNWMLSSPMVISAPVQDKLGPQNPFVSQVSSFHILAVKVLKGGKVIGFYILREKGAEISVKYLYYEKTSAVLVFDSLLANIIKLKADVLLTRDKQLTDYICSKNIHRRLLELPVSFSYPQGSIFNGSLSVQAGDGDMLT